MKIIEQLKEADELEGKLGDLKEEIEQKINERVLRWLHIVKNDPVQKNMDLQPVVESMQQPDNPEPFVEAFRLMMDDRVRVKICYGRNKTAGVYLDRRILADDDEGFEAIKTAVQSRIDTKRMQDEQKAIEAEKMAKVQRRLLMHELLNEFGPEIVDDWLDSLGLTLPKKG